MLTSILAFPHPISSVDKLFNVVALCPKTFDIVKLAKFLVKDVNDNRTVIQRNPFLVNVAVKRLYSLFGSSSSTKSASAFTAVAEKAEAITK